MVENALHIHVNILRLTCSNCKTKNLSLNLPLLIQDKLAVSRTNA